LRCDPALRLSLGMEARDAVVRAHTWDSVVKRVFELCHLESSVADAPVGAAS
jgi:hypothetical protein